MPSDHRSLPLFLDCDPGIDDAIALGYLFCQDDVDVVGIAASGGNVPTAQVVRNTQGWIDLAEQSGMSVHPGHDLPLAWHDRPGSGDSRTDSGGAPQPEYADLTHGATGAGYAQFPAPLTPISEITAAQAWVDAARAHPGELIGVVLGPATNLALALDIEPELPHLVKRLFIMGGAFNYRGNTHPTTEWNVTFDPEATARVLSAFGAAHNEGTARYVPVIAPIEVTEAVEMTPERLADILAGSEKSARADTSSDADRIWHGWLAQLAEALRFYFEFHEWDGLGYLAHIHDPFVLACAIAWARDHLGEDREDPASIPNGTVGALPWAQTIHAPVDVELTGTLTRGETVADWLGRWERETNAEIIRTIEAAEFLDHLGEVLRSGPRIRD